MNYDDYKLNLSDWSKVSLESFIITGLVSYLFFDSVWSMLFFPIVIWLIYRKEKTKIIVERKEKLTMEFMDMLKNISSNLLAGYSLENSWIEAEKEIALLYGERSNMYLELKEMNRQISINQPIEKTLEEFALRTGVDDIQNFSDIFSFAKRSGGKFVEIIENTTYRMWDKFETKREIQVAVSAKKLEQKAMDVIPIFILFYLKLASYDYLSALYGNMFGTVFMSICLAIYAAAVFIAERMLDIKI